MLLQTESHQLRNTGLTSLPRWYFSCVRSFVCLPSVQYERQYVSHQRHASNYFQMSILFLARNFFSLEFSLCLVRQTNIQFSCNKWNVECDNSEYRWLFASYHFHLSAVRNDGSECVFASLDVLNAFHVYLAIHKMTFNKQWT